MCHISTRLSFRRDPPAAIHRRPSAVRLRPKLVVRSWWGRERCLSVSMKLSFLVVSNIQVRILSYWLSLTTCQLFTFTTKVTTYDFLICHFQFNPQKSSSTAKIHVGTYSMRGPEDVGIAVVGRALNVNKDDWYVSTLLRLINLSYMLYVIYTCFRLT
jgi:hypothetical protein